MWLALWLSRIFDPPHIYNLKRMGACPNGIAWARQFKNAREMIAGCKSAEDAHWLLIKLDGVVLNYYAIFDRCGWRLHPEHLRRVLTPQEIDIIIEALDGRRRHHKEIL